MTKELYPVPGRIKVHCRVTSIRRAKKFTSEEIGTNSMNNVARDYKSKIFDAKLNAIYKHMNRGGGSDATVEVIDFDIMYFTNKVKIHKETRINKNNEKVKYAYAVDKNTGRRVNRERKIINGDIKDFE